MSLALGFVVLLSAAPSEKHLYEVGVAPGEWVRVTPVHTRRRTRYVQLVSPLGTKGAQ